MTIAKAILFDVDGTLADLEHRLKYVHQTPKDWHAFHSSLMEDTPHEWCLELLNLYRGNGYKVILMTGRGEEYRDLSLKWFEKYDINYDELLMRPAGDQRHDWEIKKELYENFVKDNYDIRFVVEDRKSVVKMWRDIGLVCLQCAPGDF